MRGQMSGMATSPAIRADGRAVFAAQRNCVSSTPVGATLMSVRTALDALVADLVARNQFIERPVAGRPSREIVLSFGPDKGERQSTCTAVLACIH